MPKPGPLLLFLAFFAFISLGLPDTVFGVAWPSLRSEFGISQSAMGLLLAAGVTGYFLSGLLAGVLMRRLGVGGLLTISSGLVALSLAGYALAPSIATFLPFSVTLGLGSGAIDSGLNGYAARHFSVRQVNWLHACWGVGASLGPVIMTAALARTAGHHAGYGALGLILAAMALAFLFTRRAWDASSASPPSAEASAPSAEPGFGAALRDGRVRLHLLTFFVYVGLEATLGQWCFSVLRERRGLSIEAAGAWTAAFWASLTVGRIVFGSVVDRVGPDRLLRAVSLSTLAGTLAFVISEGLFGQLGLLVAGMSLAPVFPTLMARTPARLGSGLARHAIGFQISAGVLGACSLPALTGVFVAARGLGAALAVMLVSSLAFLIVHELLLRTGASSVPLSASAG